MLNVEAIGNAFAESNPAVVATAVPPVTVETPKPAAPKPAETAAVPAELLAKRDAKVLAIVKALKPKADDKYASARYTAGKPVGTMAVKVWGYFKDLYRASHPVATPATTTNPDAAAAAMRAARTVAESACFDAVKALIQGALDRGIIWSSTGGENARFHDDRRLMWYYASDEYPKPVAKPTKAEAAIATAKAEAAELGW